MRLTWPLGQAPRAPRASIGMVNAPRARHISTLRCIVRLEADQNLVSGTPNLVRRTLACVKPNVFGPTLLGQKIPAQQTVVQMVATVAKSSRRSTMTDSALHVLPSCTRTAGGVADWLVPNPVAGWASTVKVFARIQIQSLNLNHLNPLNQLSRNLEWRHSTTRPAQKLQKRSWSHLSGQAALDGVEVPFTSTQAPGFPSPS